MGSDINNGGQIGARLSNGGVSAVQEGELTAMGLNWTMNGLTQVYNGYGPGPIKNGAYTFWVPGSEKDLELKPAKWRSETSPQILHLGYVTPFSVGNPNIIPLNALRVIVGIDYECTTSKQCIPVSITPINQGVITYVKALIDSKDLNTSMENDLHDDIIKWSTLPLDVINANLPGLQKAISGAGPLLKKLGFSFF
jgi:hypothetical protein